MRVILEPADKAEVRDLAVALERCGLAVVENSGVAHSLLDGSLQECDVPLLKFDFDRVQKKAVYQAFLELYSEGGIGMSNKDLIAFLARHTNLGSESSITTLFYRYKQQIHL